MCRNSDFWYFRSQISSFKGGKLSKFWFHIKILVFNVRMRQYFGFKVKMFQFVGKKIIALIISVEMNTFIIKKVIKHLLFCSYCTKLLCSTLLSTNLLTFDLILIFFQKNIDVVEIEIPVQSNSVVRLRRIETDKQDSIAGSKRGLPSCTGL